jgi:hypothetical protein
MVAAVLIFAGLTIAHGGSVVKEGAPEPDMTGEAATLSTDQGIYCYEEPITVSIKNDSSFRLITQTGHSFCSWVDFAALTDQGWRAVAPCIAGAPPSLVRIEPGNRESMTFTPGHSLYQPLVPGQYRAAVVLMTENAAPQRIRVIAKFAVQRCDQSDRAALTRARHSSSQQGL